MSSTAIQLAVSDLWERMEAVCDPEIPVLTVLDMGIVRRLEVQFEHQSIVSGVENKENSELVFNPALVSLKVEITPTYTGCPAMNMIAAHIQMELLAMGIPKVAVKEVLSPAWTTDWMTESGKAKLKEYGIAPPQNKARLDKMLFEDVPVPCPLCGSSNTERMAEFGSTACKSLHRCLDCREPFDYFKCH